MSGLPSGDSPGKANVPEGWLRIACVILVALIAIVLLSEEGNGLRSGLFLEHVRLLHAPDWLQWAEPACIAGRAFVLLWSTQIWWQTNSRFAHMATMLSIVGIPFSASFKSGDLVFRWLEFVMPWLLLLSSALVLGFHFTYRGKEKQIWTSPPEAVDQLGPD